MYCLYAVLNPNNYAHHYKPLNTSDKPLTRIKQLVNITTHTKEHAIQKATHAHNNAQQQQQHTKKQPTNTQHNTN